MRIGIENILMAKFDSRPVLKRWLKTGKRHIRGHKTKSKKNLSELATSEEEFFIHLTSYNSCIPSYTLLSEIFVAKKFHGSSLISDNKGTLMQI